MKISIVSCVFPPEPVISARTSGELAEVLMKQGHLVRVITAFPSRPAGKLYKGYRRKLWVHERSATGYDTLRIFSFLSYRSSMLSRFLENISFGISAALAVLLLGKPDVLYGITWPIFAQALLVLICKWRRIRLVLNIQDLYPESLSVQKRGIESSSKIYKSLHWLDTWIAKNCVSIIVISEQFRETYIHNRGIPGSKINVIPNWITVPEIITSISDDIRKQHDIPADAFLAVYGGNIGVAASVETLINSYRYLSEKYYLLIAGDGSRLGECQRLSAQVRPRQIKFYCPWPTAQTYPTYSIGDVLVLPTLGTQSLVSLPSKMLGYMLAGKPIIALASPDSELATLVRLSGCGWVISPDEPEKLADQIERVSKLGVTERISYGLSGKNYLLSHMTAQVCLPRICKVFEEALQARK